MGRVMTAAEAYGVEALTGRIQSGYVANWHMQRSHKSPEDGSIPSMPLTLSSRFRRQADRVAFANHDIDRGVDIVAPLLCGESKDGTSALAD